MVVIIFKKVLLYDLFFKIFIFPNSCFNVIFYLEIRLLFDFCICMGLNFSIFNLNISYWVLYFFKNVILI